MSLSHELEPVEQFREVHHKLYALGADEQILTFEMEPCGEPADVSYAITVEPPSVTEVTIHRPSSVAWIENIAAEVTRYELVDDDLIVSGRTFDGQWMAARSLLKILPHDILPASGLRPRRDVTLYLGVLHDNVIKLLPKTPASHSES